MGYLASTDREQHKNTMKTKSTKARRKRLAAVYREAASSVANGHHFYACCAIGENGAKYYPKESFALFFRPVVREGSCGIGWWDDRALFQDWPLELRRKAQTPRVIALLLMAELAEDGQLD